jgi:DNA topoisomerase IA
MGKALVLAEKPSVAREIARVLKCHEKETVLLRLRIYSDLGLGTSGYSR